MVLYFLRSKFALIIIQYGYCACFDKRVGVLSADVIGHKGPTVTSPESDYACERSVVRLAE
jgi:hypothetical protein